MIRSLLILLCFLQPWLSYAQQQSPPEEEKYDRREEILYQSKRYRIHNNYLTFGGGFLSSNIRNVSQKQAGADYQFPIRREHFQIGVMMSGLEFLSNNHIQGHFGYGKRYEDKGYNLAGFAGVSYSEGVKTIQLPTGIAPELYKAWGGYACIQGVMKFSYDMGVGAELFYDLNQVQSMGGFRLILFFSGAYRGPKQRVNPHVRPDRKP